MTGVQTCALPILLPKTPNSPFTRMDMVRKGFGNDPFKDLTTERKRVEEFEESLR